MKSFTLKQRLEIVQIYYANSRSPVATRREFQRKNGDGFVPSEQQIGRVIKKLESEFSLHDKKVPVRRRNARSAENVAAVSASVRDNSNVSVNRRSQELGLSRMTMWRILRIDLGLHPYKIVLAQELKPHDHSLRRAFSDWALEMLEADPDFHKKIIFSDEAHFSLNGFVNKHNCRYWSDSNPQVVQERPLHPQKITVWCGLWSGGIIGPYFFRNDAGQAVTVNGQRYNDLLREFFIPKFDEIGDDDLYFQQDGAPPHISNDNMSLLRDKFGDSLISRNGPIAWPPRSCDLTPLDFFLWGYVKSQVYSNSPATIQDLEENITRCIEAIPQEMLGRVMENWVKRIKVCKRARGGHLNDILFKS